MVAISVLQAWGVLEYRAGNLDRARELFQQGVWAQPKGRDVCLVWQVRCALLWFSGRIVSVAHSCPPVKNAVQIAGSVVCESFASDLLGPGHLIHLALLGFWFVGRA